jgi:ABC-type glycerol-3-phosphate transport system permease component
VSHWPSPRGRSARADDPGELGTPVELVFGATALFTTPPVVFYFLMQRYFVSGLTSGAIKG